MEAPSIPSITKAFDVFLQSGLLGAIIVILLFAVYRLFVLYCDTQEKRIADSSAWKQVIDENTKAVEDLTNAERARNSLTEQIITKMQPRDKFRG